MKIKLQIIKHKTLTKILNVLIKSPEVVSPKNEQEGLTIIEVKGKTKPFYKIVGNCLPTIYIIGNALPFVK